jgi:methionyl-tRNA synthetase
LKLIISKKWKRALKKGVNKFKQEIRNLYDDYELALAAEKIDQLADWGNKYITEKEPWGKEKDIAEVQAILNNLTYLLRVVIDYYEPIIPESSQKALLALEKRERIILFNKIP